MDEKTYAGTIGEVLEWLGRVMDDALNSLFSRDKRRLKETERAFAAHLESNLSLALLPALRRVGMDAEDLLGGIRTTVEAEIPFTDKALSEISEIMALVKDLARNANDALITRHARFREYALSSARDLLKRADKYGLEHQRRLIVGICSPNSSFPYLDVMDSLRRLAADLAALLKSA